MLYLYNIGRNEIHSYNSIFFNYIQKLRCIILKTDTVQNLNVTSSVLNLQMRHIVT